MSGMTSLCRFWPMMFDTIALVVEAKAHEHVPNNPKSTRMLLDTASAISP